jgi:hypothetical protein
MIADPCGESADLRVSESAEFAELAVLEVVA